MFSLLGGVKVGLPCTFEDHGAHFGRAGACVCSVSVALSGSVERALKCQNVC